jgi:hypothetical protein
MTDEMTDVLGKRERIELEVEITWGRCMLFEINLKVIVLCPP